MPRSIRFGAQKWAIWGAKTGTKGIGNRDYGPGNLRKCSTWNTFILLSLSDVYYLIISKILKIYLVAYF